ncbi:MAG: 2-amino-4-hydroxy-6-hydroxymethyldihydropteridine diphosphokinase [Pseudomonadales bacterium]|nr:2-amino-4-hydroxy-6-hydroxymethyldihydropteridine diphosphokinase [Pseudomonadales bacterium]
METATALVAVGANLGDPRAQVADAMGALTALASDASGVRCSSLWASRPVDCPPGSPDFVNAVVALPVSRTTDPEALLDALQHLEAQAGRVREVPNGPRTLDLDLLLLDDLRCATARLTLPHPRGHLRAFVLLPAAEVAADLPWPGRGRSIGELAVEVAGRDALRRLA